MNIGNLHECLDGAAIGFLLFCIYMCWQERGMTPFDKIQPWKWDTILQKGMFFVLAGLCCGYLWP